jgi:hypothetical protein
MSQMPPPWSRLTFGNEALGGAAHPEEAGGREPARRPALPGASGAG